MKRKLLSFITTLSIIASIAGFLPLSAHAEEITENTELIAGNLYKSCKVTGSDNPDNPVVITIPKEGVSFDYFTINKGYVKITGGPIFTHGTFMTIYIPKNATLTLENITIYGSDNCTAYTIGVYGDLIVKAGTEITMPADSNISTRERNSAVYIYTNAKATMYGGKIHGNFEGVSLATGAAFIMNGGEICNNIGRAGAASGGGVRVYKGTFTMNGGAIYNNKAGNYGAFYLESDGVFTMNGGVVYGNKAISNTSDDYTMWLNALGDSGSANLNGGLFLGTVHDNSHKALNCNNMYMGTIERLSSDDTTITDKNTGAVVSGAKNGNTLFADKSHKLVDGNGNVAAYDEANAKWVFSEEIAVNPEFTTTADAGYYSETRDAENKIGIAAFNTLITNFEECKDDITKYGMYIYIDGTSDNSVKLESTSSEELMQQAGQFYATVSEIPSSDFNRTIVAMPYALSANEIISGEACTFNVNQGNKWLGKAE